MSESTPTPEQAAAPVKSVLGKRWVFLMILYIVGLEAFAALCIYDAMWKYPARGADAAAFNEYRYLNALELANPGSIATVNVNEPAATLTRLEAKADLMGPDQALHDWLTQLNHIGKMSPENTSFPRTDFRKGTSVGDPASRLKELKAEWETGDGKTSKKPANPLTTWDIPSQWIMLVLCGPGGLWVLITFIAAKSKEYEWDPATKTLTLPGGHKVGPSDLADIDKRKWDKLYVHLKINGSHPTLANKEIELDLKRYEPVEDWVLQMEAVAFPDRVEKEKPAEGDSPAA